MNVKQKVRAATMSALVAAAAFGAASAAEPPAVPTEVNAQVTGAVPVETASCTASVQAIDYDKRTATLRMPDGSESVLHAPKEMINFDQIKAGDEVKATLIKSVTVNLRKPGAPASVGEANTVMLAPKGAMPGAFLASTIEVTDKIIAVDQPKRLVTFDDVTGQPFTIHAGSKSVLSELKKGDEVVVRYTEGLLIAVEKEPAPEPQPAAANLPGAIDVETIRTQATVTAVDKEKRTVTLRVQDGSEQTFKAGKNVVNFDQIQVGDEVKATLVGELAIFVRKSGGAAVDGEAQAVALAARGTLPGVMMAETVQATDKIDAINRKDRTITLEDADGQCRIIHAGPKVDLKDLQKGDDVVVRFTEGLALLVEK